MISPAAADALSTFLTHRAALSGVSENTVSAYRRDITDYLAFMTLHKGAQQGLAPLTRIGVPDMRSWMAAERSGGLSARSLARKLSAVKSFYRWLSEREGFDPTAVLATRAPKFQAKLPRPLAEDAAKAVLDTVEVQAPSGLGWRP